VKVPPVTVVVLVALLTVSVLPPLLAPQPESPAKEAPTPLPAPKAYVFALIPVRLAAAIVATPLPFVVALPAATPLSVKLMLFPLRHPVPLRVAVSAAVPAKVPDAASTASVVAVVAGVKRKFRTLALPFVTATVSV
jgi:hypothetical protein